MRRHGTSFRLPSFACRVSSHQRLFRHVRGRIARYGRDESARLVPHPPRPSFKRSHDPSRVCVCARAGKRARPMSLRSTDRRTDGAPMWCVKSHGTGRGRREDRDGKLMELRWSCAASKRSLVPCARARARALHGNPQGRPMSLQWPRGESSVPLRAGIGERWLVKLIRVKWSLNGTRIDR